MPEAVRSHNRIPAEGRFEDDFDRAFADLVKAIETDLPWVRAHTRGIEATRWEEAGGEKSLLLRGSALQEAERWLGGQADTQPEPTALQTEFILASRQASTRRQRGALAAVGAPLLVTAALAVFALRQRSEAISQKRDATSREMAAAAVGNLKSDPELSLLLASEAGEESGTEQATDALRRSLDAAGWREVLRGHRDSVISAAFSPDGKKIVTAGLDLQGADLGRGERRADAGPARSQRPCCRCRLQPRR